jgi:elongation factor 1 alpha-like protein
VSNVFRGGGIASGIAVSGRLASGIIQVGEKVRVLPGDESAIVRSKPRTFPLARLILRGA